MVYLRTKFRFSSFSGLENALMGGHFGFRWRLFFNVFLHYRDLLAMVHVRTKFHFSSSNSVKNGFRAAVLNLRCRLFQNVILS